jgi:hypothetical protein
MTTIPRVKRFDATLALSRDPYAYISATCRHRGADAFETPSGPTRHIA